MGNGCTLRQLVFLVLAGLIVVAALGCDGQSRLPSEAKPFGVKVFDSNGKEIERGGTLNAGVTVRVAWDDVPGANYYLLQQEPGGVKTIVFGRSIQWTLINKNQLALKDKKPSSLVKQTPGLKEYREKLGLREPKEPYIILDVIAVLSGGDQVPVAQTYFFCEGEDCVRPGDVDPT